MKESSSSANRVNSQRKRARGGHAGIRVGETQNPGPATHARDRTVTEQPNGTHRREPAYHGLPCGIFAPASPATANNGADAHLASADGGLMQHLVQRHGGRVLLADSVGQLLGDTFHDRQPGHQCAAGSGMAAGQQPPHSASSLWTTARCRTALLGTSF